MLTPGFEQEAQDIDKLLKDIVNNFDNLETGTYLKIYIFVSHYGNKDEEAEYLYRYIMNFIEEKTKELSERLKDKPKSEIIDLFIDIANKMDIIIHFLMKTFGYLDFYYVRSKNLDKITKVALGIYRKNIFLPIQNQLIEEVNKLLKEDRLGKKEHRAKIKQILNIMKTMDLSSPKIFRKEKSIIWENEKKDEIESLDNQEKWFNLFTKDTEEFLAEKLKEDIQKNSIPEYISKQLEFLKEEKQRQEELSINEIFLKRLNEVIYKKIIEGNLKEIIEEDTGLNSMLENHKFEELTNLFELFKFYEPSLKELANVVAEYVKTRGKLLREKEEIKAKPELFAQQLTELQNEINSMVEKCFKNNEIILSAEKKVFNELMNTEN